MIDWNAVSAIGQLVGAIGVIVSIGYLAVQIRTNTRAVQGGALQAIAETHQHELRWGAELAPIWNKLRRGDALAAEEESALNSWLLAAFTARQNEFAQYRRGLIDEDAWRTYERIMSHAILPTAHVRAWWRSGFTRSVFHPEFVAHVDALVAAAESSEP